MTKTRLWCSKHNKTVPFIITVFIWIAAPVTILNIFTNIEMNIADIDPFYTQEIVDFTFKFFLTLGLVKLLYPQWSFGFKKDGLKNGVENYGIIIILAVGIMELTAYFVVRPLDHAPSLQIIVVEWFIYLVAVGFFEEIFWRGLLLNALKNNFAQKKYGVLNAVIISASVFGFVHVVGMFGEASVFDVFIRMLYVTSYGVFLGAVYVKTKNIWVPIIAHNLTNFAGITNLFSTPRILSSADFLYIPILVYVILGVFGIFIVLRETKQTV
jgi:membrane protease YdiL (CAAX protease family)